jgi:uncharacterized membrane protein YfcA
METQDWAVLGVITLAGFVRGVTGFGGAMVMAPPLSLLLGPVKAVVCDHEFVIGAQLPRDIFEEWLIGFARIAWRWLKWANGEA